VPLAPTATPDQILDAAEALFARRGFAATTIKQIAGAAGVNSALLYYYFADKERLYRAALDRLVRRMFGRTAPRLDAAGRPEDRLRAFLEAQVEVLLSHPHLYPLILRELVDYGAAHAVEQIRLVAATAFRRLCAVIEEGQRGGVFRRELDPRFAAISSVSVILHFFTARPAIGIFLGYTTAGPPAEVTRAYARHAVDFALAALAARPAHPARPAARRRARAR
jgi:TetR/AcrR family transcriptional regulator